MYHSMIVWLVTDRLSFLFNNLSKNIQEKQIKGKCKGTDDCCLVKSKKDKLMAAGQEFNEGKE